MIQLVVIADDFSGCTDAEIQLSALSVRSLSLLPHADVKEYAEQADALVIDNEARFESGPRAYRLTRDLAQQLKELGVSRIYKKIDSTFRGNIGDEVEAVMDAWGMDFCAVVPAYPANGRTTRDGHHYVNGELISHTEFANDPVHPVRDSYLPGILQAQTRRKVGLVSLKDVRGSVEGLASAMDRALASGTQILIVDAETARDQGMIGLALRRLDRLDFVAGSAGMFSELVQLLRLPITRAQPLQPLPGPCLTVCGSLHPASEAQVKALAGETRQYVHSLNVSRLEDTLTQGSEVRNAIYELTGRIQRGESVILTTFQDRLEPADVQAFSNSLIAHLERIIAEVRIDAEFQNLCLTGGVTALAVCNALQLDGVSVFDQVEPGIALCRSLGSASEYRMVIKPGGFGSEQALIKGYRMLSGEEKK